MAIHFGKQLYFFAVVTFDNDVNVPLIKVFLLENLSYYISYAGGKVELLTLIKRIILNSYNKYTIINFQLFLEFRAGRIDIDPAKALERRQRLARFFRA